MVEKPYGVISSVLGPITRWRLLCLFLGGTAYSRAHVDLSLKLLLGILTWMEKYGTMWKDLIVHLLNSLKTNEKLHFTTLDYAPNYTLHPKIKISIQVNHKLIVRVRSVTRVIV